MIYYSIRVVNAKTYEEAVKKVRVNDFEEGDHLCDQF